MQHLFKDIKHDLPASIVVFFVAVPLCLGIALASGAPLFAGIIAGFVGGIVVGAISGSPLGVSGPAAGLAVIVFTAIESLGSYEAFLLSVVFAGILQVLMGLVKAGIIAYFFPSSVIKGMLTGIGILIILKQIPHAFGYDKNFEGDLSFSQPGGENTFTSIFSAFQYITPGALLIAVISIAILLLWDKVLTKKHKVFQILQGPIVVVLLGILFYNLFQAGVLNFSLRPDQMVQLPESEGLGDFLTQFTFPDFSHLANPEIYQTAVVLAIVASLETLLCVEATDKLDPQKRVTPTNRELIAQGSGNMLSGFIGGLPVTQVIVRSSANISFGGRTKMSAILHGVFLLISAITLAGLLNQIPLASLAAILIMVGYKLAKPALFKQMYSHGWEQFIPFMATIIGIVATDLLRGIAIGMVFGIFFTLRHSYRNSHYKKESTSPVEGQPVHHIVLAEEVTFLNKANILKSLNEIPDKTCVVIDGRKSVSIDHDVLEIIRDFEINAKTRHINVELKGIATEEEEIHSQSLRK